MHDQSLQKNPSNLLLHIFILRLLEKNQQYGGEVARVAVRESQLIDHGVEQEVTALRIRITGQVLEDIQGWRISYGCLILQLNNG